MSVKLQSVEYHVSLLSSVHCCLWEGELGLQFIYQINDTWFMWFQKCLNGIIWSTKVWLIFMQKKYGSRKTIWMLWIRVCCNIGYPSKNYQQHNHVILIPHFIIIDPLQLLNCLNFATSTAVSLSCSLWKISKWLFLTNQNIRLTFSTLLSTVFLPHEIKYQAGTQQH